MLASPSTLRSDPVVMCGLLARAALRAIEAPAEKDSRDVFISTLIRLLEMYRFEALQERNPQGILDHRPMVADAIAMSAGTLPMVDAAIGMALAAAYPDEETHSVAALLQGHLADLRDGRDIQAADQARVRRFIEALIEALTHP